MKERILLKYVYSDMEFYCDFLKWASDWCKKNWRGKAFIRNAIGGDEIFVEIKENHAIAAKETK